jgi:cytochrome c556
LVLLLVGLAVGALCTLIAVNALHRGTAYPNAVMAMMGQQMKALDKSVKQSRCSPADLTPRLQTLRFVANDIEPAFAEREEAQFGRYASDLRAAADAALMTPPASCAAATAAIGNLGKACDSCHRDFKD